MSAVLDPWKAVARRTAFLLGTASDNRDPRGAFVGIALRPPPEGDTVPAAMQRAMDDEEFLKDLIVLLARWGIIR